MFLDFWPILMFFNFVLRILWEMIQFDDFFSTGWFDRASSKYNLKESPRNDKWKKVIFQVLYVLRVPAVSSFLREGLVIDDGSITNYVHFWDSIWMEIYLYLHESFQKKHQKKIIPSLKKNEFQCILFLFWNCYLPYLSSFFPELPVLWLQGCLKGPHLAQRARSSAVHGPSSHVAAFKRRGSVHCWIWLADFENVPWIETSQITHRIPKTIGLPPKRKGSSSKHQFSGASF